MGKLTMTVKYLKHNYILFKLFISDCFGFIRSFFIFNFNSVRKPAVFDGFKSYYFACKYADKRSNNWKTNWDQMGKKQVVIPFTKT